MLCCSLSQLFCPCARFSRMRIRFALHWYQEKPHDVCVCVCVCHVCFACVVCLFWVCVLLCALCVLGMVTRINVRRTYSRKREHMSRAVLQSSKQAQCGRMLWHMRVHGNARHAHTAIHEYDRLDVNTTRSCLLHLIHRLQLIRCDLHMLHQRCSDMDHTRCMHMHIFLGNSIVLDIDGESNHRFACGMHTHRVGAVWGARRDGAAMSVGTGFGTRLRMAESNISISTYRRAAHVVPHIRAMPHATCSCSMFHAPCSCDTHLSSGYPKHEYLCT